MYKSEGAMASKVIILPSVSAPQRISYHLSPRQQVMMQPTRFLALALLAVLSLQEVIAAPNLTPGVFRIESVIKGNPPLAVSSMKPGFQTVYLNGLVKTWVVRKEGATSYRFSVGGYPYTGIVDNKLTASIHIEQNVEWIVSYKEHQDAYTIEPANAPGKGWTTSSDDDRAQVSIKNILVLPSVPPQYSSSQLWRFVPTSG